MQPRVFSSVPKPNKSEKPPLRDRMIPWYFVMAFGVVFAVNMLFVYKATHTHRGVVQEQAYETGLAYNAVIASANAQAALGWKSSIEQQGEWVRVHLQDAQGEPISGAQAQMHLKRNSDKRLDTTLPLSPYRAGEYRVSAEGLLKGKWNVILEATWQQQPYQKQHVLILR